MKRFFILLLILALLTGSVACDTESASESNETTEETSFDPSPEEAALLTAMNGVWKGRGSKEDFYFACLENKVYFFTKSQFVKQANAYFVKAVDKEGAGAYNQAYAKKDLPAMNFPEFAQIQKPQIDGSAQSISFSEGTVTLLADGPVFTQKTSTVYKENTESLLKLEKFSSDFSLKNSEIENLFEEVKSLCSFQIKDELPTPKEYAETVMQLMCLSNVQWTTTSNEGGEVLMTGTDNSNAYYTFHYYLKYNDREMELSHEHSNRLPGYIYNQSLNVHYIGGALFVETENFGWTEDFMAAFTKGLPGELSATAIKEKAAKKRSFPHGAFTYTVNTVGPSEKGILQAIVELR